MTRRLAIITVLLFSCFGQSGGPGLLGPGTEPKPDDGSCRDEVHALTGSMYSSFQCSHSEHAGVMETRTTPSGCQTKAEQYLVCTCKEAE